ncbi:MAG: HAMP domain-containing histidine kinase, partial [Bacteroidetes bacterium]|nr:HAMP domain-containing histidine kinase [Bacteroidota bacterium]
MLQYILIHQLDDTLKTEETEIKQYRNVHHALPEITPTRHQVTTYTPITDSFPARYRTVKLNERNDMYRQVQFGVEAAGKYYLVTVSRPLEETEDLLQVIILVTIIMIACILLVGYMVNRVVLSGLWKPFYKTLDRLSAYELSSQEVLDFTPTGINEFDLLNENVQRMTHRVQADYQSLKEFTAHAAHEMQTPLAIIRSKLDVLMQQDIVLKHEGASVSDIENAVSRLSKLNQSLLLLTKVENRQFVLNEQVDMEALLKSKVSELLDIIDARHLSVNIVAGPTVIKFHRHLADIILNNLLGNAIRYNREGGTIDISLQNNALIVSNTSSLPMLDRVRLFQKFYRHSDVGEDGSG